MTDAQVDRIVKIQGTNYDRRRKLTLSDIAQIKREYKNGVSIMRLAEKYHVTYPTIKYHVAENYKEQHNKYRLNFKFTEFDANALRKSRISYKRQILAEVIN